MRAISLLVFLALAGSATAAVLGRGEPPGAQASAVSAEGSFGFASSRDGMPIFSAAAIGPGDSVSGTVEIADTGTLPGELTVSRHDVEDVGGTGGGRLSEQLSLRIADVSDPGEPVVVYSGPLATMPAREAGLLEPGQSRTYEFVATLPESGAPQNDLQGASTSVAYAWTAHEAAAPASPGPAPSADPLPAPGGPRPEPGASPAPAAPALRLAITRVRRALHGGRLLVWASCDSSCRIVAHGRFRVRGPGGSGSAGLRLAPRAGYAAGIHRLRIRVPHRLRRLLESSPSPVRLSARIVLRAYGPGGAQATARRALRLRSASRSVRAGRSGRSGLGR